MNSAGAGIMDFAFPIIILIGIFYYLWSGKRGYNSLPTVEEYMSKFNPSQGKGLSCRNCDSHNIWDERAGRIKFSRKRIHYCKQCNTTLYRSLR